MIANSLKTYTLALAPLALLPLTSCCSWCSRQEPSKVAFYQEGVPGGMIVQTTSATATVTAVDPASRRVTMVTPEGRKTTFKAGPEVANFDQLQVGDQVKATVTEEVVVFMLGQDEKTVGGEATAVALAPLGAKPGVLVADTVQMVVKVVAIDLRRQRATLELPDGTRKTVPVRQDIDLTKRRVGEELVVRCTEAVAILVEKP